MAQVACPVAGGGVADGGARAPGGDAGPGTTGPDAGVVGVDVDAGDAGTFAAPFLWAAIELAGAPSLGFVAQAVPAAERVPAGEVRLEEAGAAFGLGTAVSQGNAHGVGLALVDIDNDGWDDLFVINGRETPSKLWHNLGGVFIDHTAPAGLSAIFSQLDGYSIAAADVDHDGDIDVYVGARPRDLLLLNLGDGTFYNGTANAGAGGPAVDQPGTSSKIVSFGDIDGDGWADLVSSYSSLEQIGKGYLLRNQGDGTFTDATEATGFRPSPTGNPCAALWTDYDNDGDQDLMVWNDRGDRFENRVLLRNHGGAFADVSAASGLHAHNIGNPMGIDAADINRDGFLDYYVADIGHNPLYLGGPDGVFTNISEQAGTLADYSWGLGFEDFNLDGWPDIFVAQEDNRLDRLYTHNQDTPPTFTESRWVHNPAAGAAHNVAAVFADLDHDGRIDVVRATTDGSRVTVFRNVTDIGTNHWLEVRITDEPGLGGTGAVAARVVVKAGDVVQFRDIRGGSSRGSQNPLAVRFGLGPYTGAEWVAALFPDGRQLAVRHVPADRVLDLAHP